MAIDLEDDILQDFLVEAGEILESLNEQLVDLEQTPEDSDLLNAIFRGFHTIKGGASFLALTNLVDVCHKSEDVFNLLRNRELALDADMMDAFLRVLDEVNSMFEQIRAGEDPSPADPGLIQELIAMQNPDTEVVPAAAEETTDDGQEPGDDQLADALDSVAMAAVDGSMDQDSAEVAGAGAARDSKEFVSGSDEISDEEFESLLDALKGSEEVSAEQTARIDREIAESDEITDDEFEALLDELHGKGGAPSGSPAVNSSPAQKPAPETRSTAETGAPDENITDDEFEALLDQMHGKGKGPTSKGGPGAERSAPRPKPAEPPKQPDSRKDSVRAEAPQPAAPRPAE